MAFIDWTDEYSVDIPEIDKQHLILVDMINELHEAMRARKGKEFVTPLIDRLAEYTVTHFTFEEKLFSGSDYPDVEKHKKIHQTFVDKVEGFKKESETRKLFLSIEIMDFLKDWLMNHILKQDKEGYRPYVLKMK